MCVLVTERKHAHVCAFGCCAAALGARRTACGGLPQPVGPAPVLHTNGYPPLVWLIRIGFGVASLVDRWNVRGCCCGRVGLALAKGSGACASPPYEELLAAGGNEGCMQLRGSGVLLNVLQLGSCIRACCLLLVAAVRNTATHHHISYRHPAPAAAESDILPFAVMLTQQGHRPPSSLDTALASHARTQRSKGTGCTRSPRVSLCVYSYAAPAAAAPMPCTLPG